ncbi:MAG: HEAT repeat domain-containing protein [Planctomycetota bacterium]
MSATQRSALAAVVVLLGAVVAWRRAARDPVAALAEGAIEARRGAALVLAQRGAAKAAGSVDALIAALADEDLRDAAVYALGEIGAAARPALPALLRQLEGANDVVRMRLAWALMRIDPHGAGVRAAVQELAGSENVLVRACARGALGRP